MKTTVRAARFLSLLVLAAACGRRDSATDESVAKPVSPAPDSGAMGGTPVPQPGTGGGQDDLDGEMRSHLARMHGATGDSLLALVSIHRQMAANMLARMNREMGQMNMAADAAWTAAVDSVRQDLTRMPEMSGEELKAVLPSHEARLLRLGRMHHSMMGNMQM